MSPPAGRSADVAIVGGGIVGTATAAFLAAAGARVSLYERTEIAAGASGRNSGVIQQPHDPVLAALYRESLAAHRALDVTSGGALALDAEPVGLLQVGHDLAVAEAIAAAWRETDPSTRPEVLGGDELRRLEPALAADLVACRLRIGYPVAPSAATLAFAAEAERGGATVVIGQEARLVVENGVAVGVEVGGSLRPAGAVVIAAGPWTPAVLDPSAVWQPIRPIWGVVVQVDLADAPRHVLEQAEIDIEPGADPDADPSADPDADDPTGSDAGDVIDFSLVTAGGASSLGSTFLAREPRAADFVDLLRARGARFVPAVATAPVVGVRSCARPVSVDGRPLVGAVPWLDRAFVAAGHGPWGISTGPATARMIADLVLGNEAGIPPALAAGRFGRNV
jgi:glycine/D-amino acid oxidase-like deaminating enzyme